MLWSCPTNRALTVVSSILLALLVLGAGARPASAEAYDKHDAKKQVEALEEQWRTAQLAGDIATMDKMLSEDFIGISMSGQVNTKAQLLDRVRAHKVALSKVELSDMKVKLIGGIAIVTSRAEVEGTNEGASVKGTYRYTRVYQRLPSGGWKITSFEATRVPGHKVKEEQISPIPSTPLTTPQPRFKLN
jgi:ketosteroid isomerase-like protein